MHKLLTWGKDLEHVVLAFSVDERVDTNLAQPKERKKTSPFLEQKVGSVTFLPVQICLVHSPHA